MAVRWTKDLAVGNSEIDGQHQELFAAVDAIVTAVTQGRGREEIARTIKFLEAYTAFHFSAEERLMADIRYPGIELQRREHAQFVRDLAEWKHQYESEGPPEGFDLIAHLEHRLVAWLRTHVAVTDHALGEFLASRRQAQ
jgi:hemerythrin-like metal-binding protein